MSGVILPLPLRAIMAWAWANLPYLLFFILIRCTVHLLRIIFTMTNKCTIFSQIITLLHVSTLSCHPQGACS